MNEIIQGDCIEVMKTFPDSHFSAIVTDPPYGLHFMGKDWDQFTHTALGDHKDTRKRNGSMQAGKYYDGYNDEFQRFMFETATEALRILKPGGHVLMFGAPRRYHRQVCALEDAGFEIRDCLMWIFGSGFPKSHNGFGIPGFGTALKPAYEPIIMAMKPCDGTFKQNAEKWGQAGINIDGCRIPANWDTDPNKRGLGYGFTKVGSQTDTCFSGLPARSEYDTTKGRWPANVILDEEAAAMLDEQSGHLKSGGSNEMSIKGKGLFMSGSSTRGTSRFIGSSGGASRFFYCAKASSSERGEINKHPTVKPLKLMEYLIKLVMPPKNGVLLDPFAGSGSTILAAKRLGFSAVGIEKHLEYVEIATARLNNYAPGEEETQLGMGF